MGLSRRSAKGMSGTIWPGFVDAMTALLLVLMFVLTIFMIVQFMLRETITGQETELDELSSEVAALAQALGLEQRRAFDLEQQVGLLDTTLSDARSEAEEQAALIASLTSQSSEQDAELARQRARITSFEAQVASLLAERDAARATGEALSADLSQLNEERDRLISDQEALQLALAKARDEVDAGVEAARLAAARRAAIDALIADLRQRVSEGEASLADLAVALKSAEDAASENEAARAELQNRLTDEEAARLAETAAAEALRQRLANAEDRLTAEEETRLAEAAAAAALRESLKNAQDELTAMTLALEEQRRRAEETLTMLAAAGNVETDLTDRLAAALLGLTARDEALTAADADRDTLRRQLAEAQAALAASGSELTETSTERDDLQQRLAVADTLARSTGEELAKARDALSTANAELASLRGFAGTEEELRRNLAAAIAAKLAAEQEADRQLTSSEERAALLSVAQAELSDANQTTLDQQKKLELLNQQVAAMRAQLGDLQALLDDSKQRDSAANIQIESLGRDVNAALARAAAAERRLREAEEAERKRLETENRNLENYRSEFFGKMREILGTREGVQIVGDRFVFSSEVLFEPGSATLAAAGQAQIARVASILNEVSDEIPPEIDWVIRVDGHTDNIPLSGLGEFRNNWELSQARALSVVEYMTDRLGFDPARLAATGFGEFQPVNREDSDAARAQNRRIELKLTER